MKLSIQPIRWAVLLWLTVVLGGVLAAHAYARPEPPGDGPGNARNRLEASFAESLVPGSFRCNGELLCQAFLTGAGTVDGMGAVTEVVGSNQDRSVTFCGPGSAIEQSIRRIMTADGNLVLRGRGTTCLTPSGPIVTSTFEVDGLASSGVFADASGRGEAVVDIATGAVTLSGTLTLASDRG